MEDIKTYIEYIARILESIGVLTIFIGAIISLIKFIISIKRNNNESYKLLRQNLGKAILLGLEILIAADIIATVVTEPTMNKVLTLGMIVLIRIILSLSLQVDVEGKFPWQEKRSNRNKT